MVVMHQYLGYLLLFAIWFVVVWSGWNAYRVGDETRAFSIGRRAFVGFVDLQVVFGGIIVWQIGPSLATLLAPWLNHVLLMILAAVLAHVGNRTSGWVQFGLFLGAGVAMLGGYHFAATAPIV